MVNLDICKILFHLLHRNCVSRTCPITLRTHLVYIAQLALYKHDSFVSVFRKLFGHRYKNNTIPGIKLQIVAICSYFLICRLLLVKCTTEMYPYSNRGIYKVSDRLIEKYI